MVSLFKTPGDLTKCYVCGLIGSGHKTSECPELCPCGSMHKPINHKCCVCGLIGFTHESDECPELCPCGSLHRAADHK